ncbi:hypothetical protein NTHI1209_01181 [Haemophilus influenzae]|uniref:Uncharacterized protein n=1 Tax=Haemophilus influenzae TaxID=727 RepID=A0A158SXI0_HAEIF|nr:hypothetical protein NTHI1209_01181 [Haemophilus influenzae]
MCGGFEPRLVAYSLNAFLHCLSLTNLNDSTKISFGDIEPNLLRSFLDNR